MNSRNGITVDKDGVIVSPRNGTTVSHNAIINILLMEIGSSVKIRGAHHIVPTGIVTIRISSKATGRILASIAKDSIINFFSSGTEGTVPGGEIFPMLHGGSL
jgi:hypothetical protein